MPAPDYMTPEPREEKLPAWVQDKLKLLRMRYNEALGTLAQMSPENGGTDTVADPYATMRSKELQPFFLPNGTEVKFVLGEHESISCKMRDGELQVHGSSRLVLRPESSNLIRATVRHR